MKKIIVFLLAIVLVISCFMLFTACGKQEPKTIVYLGDSIAEALLGPSPLSERENYGYFALIGRMNGYKYYNRSVSGHKSSQLLELIKREDFGVQRTGVLIKEADIIHISILGNDVLQTHLGALSIAAAKNDFTQLNGILTESRNNLDAIIKELRKLNADATIIIQTVYNPGDDDTIVFDGDVADTIASLGFSRSDYREIVERIIVRLNDVIWSYLEDNPNAYHVADVYTACDNIYKQNRQKGNLLIYPDWVHPSNYGHAVMADETQKILDELGLANKKALANYKNIKIEQLERLYSDSVNVKSVKRQIKKATSMQAVTAVYFDAIASHMPSYV